MEPNYRVFMLAVACLAGGLVIGVLIGWFSAPRNDSMTATPAADETISDFLREEIKAENFGEYLNNLAKEPHIAGKDVAEVTLVNYIQQKWKEFGFEVEVHPYQVLLSYPDENDPNRISILLENGTEIYKSQITENILDETQISDKVVTPFNAYSARGDAVGYLVYANYGRVDDFLKLTRDLGVDPRGHVCIVRYGMGFRGSKARTAENFGCSGLIIYSDPVDYTVPGRGVYPDSWYLPGTGVQRGTLQVDGDPLTPEYPAFENAWRMWENETTLPRIPVTPIGYDDAMKYLERMGGNEVPESWKGGLNISYRLGPGFMGTLNDTGKIKMHVTTTNEMATIHNFIGYIQGHVEPDRYVVFGNHRDSWVFGAMDASIGTTALLEMSRAMGAAVKNGWKPRRTIVVCSWGGEEYGMLGSNEWVEEFQKLLTSRAVAYLNVDTSVQGNYSFLMQAFPNLNRVIYDSAKTIPTPHDSEIAEGRQTLYETWAKRTPKTHNDPDGVPKISTLGSGSDFVQFVQVTGVASAYIRYYYDTKLNIRYWPLYHTAYDTIAHVTKFVDKGFKVNRAVTQLTAEIGRRLIDDPVIPLNCEDYALKMKEDKDAFVDKYGTLLKEHGLNLELLDQAINNFIASAKAIHERIQRLDLANSLQLRAVNDQLMQLDRAFIDSNGIGSSTNYRHTAYSPSVHNSYASTAFPGLVDSLFDIEADLDKAGRWREVERQYSILLYHIGSAASTLRETVPIKGYSNI